MHPAAQLVACSGRDVELHAEASCLLTVRDPSGSTVVSGGQNVLVLDDNGAHMPAEAGGTGGNQFGHLHEIFVSGRSLHVSGHTFNVKDSIENVTGNQHRMCGYVII
jgi:hypothetical protein